MPNRVDILGVKVLSATSDEAIAAMDGRFVGPAPVMVAFLNAHISNTAWRDETLMSALGASLVLNDGIGVDIAARAIHGAPFPANLNGTDLLPLFLLRSRHRFRIYLLGAGPGVAERARATLSAAAPRHDFVGVRDGFFSEAESAGVAEGVRASGADLLVVCMGTPRQEIWTARHLAASGCKLAVCAGGLFDFISSEKKRAPLWVRRSRFEWLYRLALEPRRLARRYLAGNPLFIARVIGARLRRRSLTG
jgi:exopolysaccharide biosynthesis WecB/TagA/CpsF family protein